MTANVDQPATNPRPLRRRLVVHALVFAIAGLLLSTVGSPTSSAAPRPQDGRFLEGKSVDVLYFCEGADEASIAILSAVGGTFPIFGVISNAPVEPSPSPGEDFDIDFTFDFELDQNLVATAAGLGVTSLDITSTYSLPATSGATGTLAGSDGPTEIILGDGTVAVGFTHHATGTFNRTADPDVPIVFTPGVINSTSVAFGVTPGGTTINILCNPDGTTISLLDQTGVPPTTTTTTRPVVTVPPTTAGTTPTTAGGGGGGVAGGGQLPVTGSSSNLMLVLVALGLIDIGYLAKTAGRRRMPTS